MPVATIDTSEYTRVDLKTLPATDKDEGGYVMIRPLPYGMKLNRRSKAVKMRMQAQTAGRGNNSADQGTIELETLDEWSTAFDFANCIGDHNLTDDKGVKLDFEQALTLKFLDPRVGSEIEEAINKLNEGESDEDLADFLRPSRISSQDADEQLEVDSQEQTLVVKRDT